MLQCLQSIRTILNLSGRQHRLKLFTTQGIMEHVLHIDLFIVYHYVLYYVLWPRVQQDAGAENGCCYVSYYLWFIYL